MATEASTAWSLGSLTRTMRCGTSFLSWAAGRSAAAQQLARNHRTPPRRGSRDAMRPPPIKNQKTTDNTDNTDNDRSQKSEVRKAHSLCIHTFVFCLYPFYPCY